MTRAYSVQSKLQIEIKFPMDVSCMNMCIENQRFGVIAIDIVSHITHNFEIILKFIF